MLNKLLDLSIYYSFDKTGFIRHSSNFNTLNFKGLNNILITGATSGIGRACAEFMSKYTKVNITGRNQLKAEWVKDNEHINFIKNDMSDWDNILKLVNKMTKLDALVLNAGGMPDKLILNNYGVESQAASQLFGHYYLLKSLIENNKLANNAKIIWVSSGGMYLKSLDHKGLICPRQYDKVGVYANVKRAQVTLLSQLQSKHYDLQFYGMHPGWVETTAVIESLPTFYEKMKDRLRSPAQGADTINWLLSEDSPKGNGDFYFDRRCVKKHFFFWTKSSEKNAKQLLQLIENKK